MNISHGFIRRPVATTLVMVAILAFGWVSRGQLPVSDLPNVDFPTLQVSAALPGASPETMAASVATPLEKEFGTIAGLDSMSSSSSQGNTQITLQFVLDRNIDAAAQDVQSAISRAARNLPTTMPTPPSFQKVNPADQPILYLALTSATLAMYDLDEYAENMLAQRISQVSGVAQVQIYGSQKYAVRVKADPTALAAKGIGIDEVANALRNANSTTPTGALWGQNRTYTVETNGPILRAEGYRPIIVASRNGQPVRLDEIARVVDGVENDKTAAWFNGQRAIVLAIQRQPGTNTVEVVKSVRALLPEFESKLPASAQLKILFDRSETIRDSVRDVQMTLALTLVLVVLVIFLFLRNVSSTLIPSLALPLSILGTFIVMRGFGYSLDNLSLMALTLALGFVVDDAIVVLENIVRHMEMGKAPLEAAIDGAREIGFTVVSMTISLSAVFIPILFMSGIMGRLFHEFAVVIGVAVLISGFISLSLTPMLASRFLRGGHQEHTSRAYAITERWFDRSLAWYDAGLTWSLRHRASIMVLTAVMMVATVWMFLVIPKGFIPDQDTGQLVAFTEGQEGIGFDSLVEHQQAMMKIVQADPAVDAFMSSCGARGSTGANQGILFFRLKPRSQREGVNAVIARLRAKVAVVPGMRAFFQNPPPIRLGGRLTKSQYQLTLQSTDTRELYDFAPKLEAEMRKLPQVRDVTTDLLLKNPQVNLKIDRDKASSLGLTAEQIDDALYSAYGFRQVSTIYAANASYQVILEVDRRYQTEPSLLSLLYVRSAAGALIPLDTIVSTTQNVGPLTVSHSGQLPSVTVSFDLAPARTGRHGDQQARDARAPRVDDHRVPGDRAGVRGLAAGARDPAGGRRPVHLHRSRHPVRELHPPADDPLRAPLRGFRRPADPDGLRPRPVGHRVRRRDPARRPGEEERHHDGRLRGRGAAQRGEGRVPRDPRRVPRQVPPDHDDDDGRPVRHAPDRARVRRGSGSTATARPRGGRRLTLFANVDAVRNTRRLHLSRRRGDVGDFPEAGAGRAHGPDGLRNIYSRERIPTPPGELGRLP